MTTTKILQMDNLILACGLGMSLLWMQIMKTPAEFDSNGLVHFLATLAGTYGGIARNWKGKGAKEIAITAFANLSLGYILGGTLTEYFTPDGYYSGLAYFALGGLISLVVVDVISIIGGKLKENSWSIFRNYTNIKDDERNDKGV